MAKLRMMLKKLGVTILGVLFCVIATGCTTEYNLATGQEETLMYGTDKEVKIGDSVAAQMDKRFKLVDDWDVNQRVQKILDRIVAVADRRDIVYSIKVINNEKLNAVSLPGGHVYIFKGILDHAKNDDQLASVIAHEVGHITAKHGIKRLQAAYGYSLLQVLAIASGDSAAARGTNAIFSVVFLAHSRQDEFQADRLGVKYMKKSGFEAQEAANMLQTLHDEHQKGPARPITYLRTHPHLPARIAVVNKAVKGKLEFRDYLNLTGYE